MWGFLGFFAAITLTWILSTFSTATYLMLAEIFLLDFVYE
jgi:hypothetical protein